MGWASAPYDPAWARRFPRRAAVMALAGPAANLSLVLAAGLAIRGGMGAALMNQPFMSLLGLLVAWQLFNPLYYPVQLAAIRLLYPGVSYGSSQTGPRPSMPRPGGAGADRGGKPRAVASCRATPL